jgi:Flp pilus assembly protein CpaB
VGLAVAVVLSAIQVLLWRASIVPEVQVAVAKTALAPRSPVSASEIYPMSVPRTAVLPSMVTSFAEIEHLYPMHAIAAGTYLTTTEFESEPLLDGLCSGQVAVTVGVQNAADAEGIYPGMYVDVTQPATGGAGGSQTNSGSVLAKGLRVLAVLNSNGQPLTVSTSSGSSFLGGITPFGTPSMVELALPSLIAPVFISASARGGLVFSRDPWGAPKTVCPSAVGGSGSGESPSGNAPPNPGGLVQPSQTARSSSTNAISTGQGIAPRPTGKKGLNAKSRGG